ncbi:MAG: ThuA domain-containing protein [Limnochordia bacterium]
MQKALIVYGGWKGHEPDLVAETFRQILVELGFSVELSDTLDAFLDADKLMGLNLIVPVWTMGKITNEQLQPVLRAVEHGVGIAGCHGGLCDAFRESTQWQFMTGGNWVAHPGNADVEYRVEIVKGSHPIVQDIDDFTVRSEQYYLHVDPAVKVLATTEFPIVDGPHSPNGRVDMPVIWIKYWGAGRVFYNSLGHDNKTIAAEPVRTLMKRGFTWAAGAEA